MTLDIYVCKCDREFAVMEDAEPNGCPFCYSQDIEWSLEVETV